MILVCGSTGTVGRDVVAGLVAGGERVRAFTRDPSCVRFDASVEVVKGDLADLGSVLAAVKGVAAVFVATSPDGLAHEPNVAEAMRRLGTAKIVKLSSVAANPPVSDSYGTAHAAAEQAFARSGAEWTTLRPAGFMSNVLQWRSSITSQGKVYQPFGDIPRAMIDPADIAAVAVTCLTTTGHHRRVYQLTGAEALTAPQSTAKISAAIGRPLEFVAVEPERARSAMLEAGIPADLVDGLLTSMADGSPERGGTPTTTVRELLGRPPATFDTWLARHRTDFGP